MYNIYIIHTYKYYVVYRYKIEKLLHKFMINTQHQQISFKNKKLV